MDDLVSIIVTSYNHSEYLDQRMKSLLNQTYRNFEIIVVDDCSTDDSLEVLKKFELEEKVTIYTFKQNHGYADACNVGVGLCHGQYIMFAECDDFNEPTHVEVMVKALQTHSSAGIAFCRSNMVDAKGEKLCEDFKFREKKFQKRCSNDTLILSKEMQRFLLFHCVIPNMSAALIRKKNFLEVGGFDRSYRICADWDFWCRISKKCNCFYSTLSLNNFRTHSTTVRNTSGVEVSMSEILRLLNNAIAKIRLSFLQLFRFRINIGIIWANYLILNPAAWCKSFHKITKEFSLYYNYSMLYFFAGLIMRFKIFVWEKLSPVAHN
jgi:glycosyltransferase involved in cell wall biosynthesis